MRPLVHALEFRGTATRLPGGVLVVDAASQPLDGVEALLEARIVTRRGGAFEQRGSISFGGLDTIGFRSLRPGTLARAAGSDLRHGAAVLVVERGSGALAAATGRITSNFLLSDTGDLTDRQLAVLFLPR